MTRDIATGVRALIPVPLLPILMFPMQGGDGIMVIFMVVMLSCQYLFGMICVPNSALLAATTKISAGL